PSSNSALGVTRVEQVDQDRCPSVWLQDAEADLGGPRRHDDRARPDLPALWSALPDAGLPPPLIPDHHIHEPVVIHIEHPYAVVPSLGVPQGLSPEQVLVDALLRLAEVQELDLLPVLRDGVVDQLDDLRVLDPAVRVEDEVEDALLEHH